METAMDVSSVQRIVLRGLGQQCVRHYLLSVRQPARARAFLRSVAKQVPSASQPRGETSVTVAVTYSGLQALQLREEYLSAFRRLAPAFVEGAAARAAAHLGDTGRNESPAWQQQFLSSRTHVVLSVYAESDAGCEKLAASLRKDSEESNSVSGWEAALAGKQSGSGSDRREPFGFRDGISQPTVKRVHLDWAQRNPPSLHVEAGEFLLGHANEDGSNRWSDEEVPAPVREFVRDGSFMALRKMRQDVAAFNELPAEVRAKMCGRWPNGALVREGETVQPAQAPGDGDANRFDFKHDPLGYGCPFASHIRRMNPRSDVVIPPRKRVLMRRGMPYAEGNEVGLLGVFVCADLERQFEFLLNNWTRTVPAQPDDRVPDPLIGARDGERAVFPIPQRTGHRPGEPFSSFVTTRGTLYGFFPSLRALAALETAI
jgi:Dyp-type peroxidase family